MGVGAYRRAHSLCEQEAEVCMCVPYPKLELFSTLRNVFQENPNPFALLNVLLLDLANSVLILLPLPQ